MDKLIAIKIKHDDGTYSDEIPISVLSENVEWDSTHTLVDVLGSIDVDAKGTIQAQIDKLSNNDTQFDTRLTSIDDDLNDFATNLVIVLGNVDVSTKGTLQDQIDKLSAQGAGAHNSIYRGKDLGTSVTYKQWAAINAGTFDDLYIGDYWVINGVNWRIAAFDYYLTTGDTACNTHHVTIVPDTKLDTRPMNSSNTTTGGYLGSAMYTANMATAKSKVIAAFGSAHILTHRLFLDNTVKDGYPSARAWVDSQIELMSEQNVYGGKIFHGDLNGTAFSRLHEVDKSQYPLFAYDPHMISNRQTYWLRNVASAVHFACVDTNGYAGLASASYSNGVRPAFSIKS